MLKNLLAGFFSPVFCIFSVRCLLVSEWDAQTLEGLVDIRFFGAFVVFMQFNPQDMWTICSAGKLPSDAKAIWQTQLNRLCPALMWCPPCFRYWHTGRLRVVGALCSVHSVPCNIMHCIFWFAFTHCNILQYVCVHCAYCSIVYIQDIHILHYIFIAISCTLEVGQAHSATVQYWCVHV